MAFFIEDIGIAEAQVLKIVIRSPILLSYSTESMRGKASYLKERLRLGDKDVRARGSCACLGTMVYTTLSFAVVPHIDAVQYYGSTLVDAKLAR